MSVSRDECANFGKCMSLSVCIKCEKQLGGATEEFCHTSGQLWYQIKVLMSLNLPAKFC